MRLLYKNSKIKYYIGDIRDKQSVDYAMEGVDFLSFTRQRLSRYPRVNFTMEAVLTNVYGTEHVIDSAIRHKVKNIILLSTDKAVYPINAMGMSKAMAEKVLSAKSRNLGETDTVLCATRYGNVMGSRGSVIPLFAKQIKAGEPITITDPYMTRFMMTLDDAVELVLYAFQNGKQGDLFVQKAPACTIEVLAQAMIDLYKSKSQIIIIGTRHGEKLFETLVNREEMVKAADQGNYYRIPLDSRDLNYSIYFSQGQKQVDAAEDYTSHNTYRMNIEETRKLLLKLPEIQEDLAK